MVEEWMKNGCMVALPLVQSDIFRLFIKPLNNVNDVMRTSTASASGVNKGSKAKWSSPQRFAASHCEMERSYCKFSLKA